MGIVSSPDIFQAKMFEFMVSLEFMRTYLYDLLCITKASLDNHLHQLRLVLTELREAGCESTPPNQISVLLKWNTLGISSQGLA
jgi:hypothetical protein